jgi:hypothetical protein
MRVFGLHPDQVLARAPAAELRASDTPAGAMIYGAVGLGVVSVIAYSIWAYKLIGGTGAMYASVAAVYIGLSGMVLSRLVVGPGATGRFAALFAIAFLAYAVAWCVFWFGLKGKYYADLWGAAAGLAAMTWLVQNAFGKTDGFWCAFGVLMGLHSLGYYLGGALHAAIRGPVGQLLWGAAHGLGFGAGVGYLVYRAQEPLKLRLRPAVPA